MSGYKELRAKQLMDREALAATLEVKRPDHILNEIEYERAKQRCLLAQPDGEAQ